MYNVNVSLSRRRNQNAYPTKTKAEVFFFYSKYIRKLGNLQNEVVTIISINYSLIIYIYLIIDLIIHNPLSTVNTANVILSNNIA